MRASLIVAAALLIGLALVNYVATAQSRSQNAAADSPPPADEPVGPIPGPGTERPSMANPYVEDAAATQDGRRLFVTMNCAGCHGDHGGGGMGPSLRDEDWIYGHASADIFDSIAHGRAHGMPAWASRLPPSEIWKLVTYIESLRTSREPQAPS
jgi:cytochrome c oxidase cbb3-type subunit III